MWFLSGTEIPRNRCFNLTLLLCEWATRMKVATARRIDRARNIAKKNVFLFYFIDIWNWDRSNERFSIRMSWILIEILAVSILDNFPKIHHSDFVTNVLNNSQIMCNE